MQKRQHVCSRLIHPQVPKRKSFFCTYFLNWVGVFFSLDCANNQVQVRMFRSRWHADVEVYPVKTEEGKEKQISSERERNWTYVSSRTVSKSSRTYASSWLLNVSMGWAGIHIRKPAQVKLINPGRDIHWMSLQVSLMFSQSLWEVSSCFQSHLVIVLINPTF